MRRSITAGWVVTGGARAACSVFGAPLYALPMRPRGVGADPARGRRAGRADAAHLPAPQGGLRGRRRRATARRRSTASPSSASTSSCSTSCCRSSTGSRSAGGCAPAARCRSSCSPRRATRSTRCVGLEMGADDYITKPFSVREFRSRVKAALRRARDGAARSPPARSRSRAGELRDRLRAPRGDGPRRAGPADLRRVRDPRRAGARRPGRVFTPRERCSSTSGATPTYRDPRTVDVHIRHLREKLERDPQQPEYLFTVRGVGYRFRDAERDRVGQRALRRLNSVRNRLRAAVLRDHRRRGRLRLPLRRPAARVEPDRREAAPARAAGAEQGPRLAARAAARGLAGASCDAGPRGRAADRDAG